MDTTPPAPFDDEVPPFAEGASAPSEIDTPVTAATWHALAAAGALATPDGAVALRLAAALDDRDASGSALAALQPRHAIALEHARATGTAAPSRQDTPTPVEPVDEIATRRARLAASGGMPR